MLAMMMTALLAGLAPAQTAEPYAGTWLAEFGGKAFVRLELRSSGNTLAGRIALGNIEVDSDGRVKAANEAPDRLTPIFDVVVRDSGLTFSRKDGNDTDRFEMRVDTGDQAELQFLPDEATLKELAESGIAVPKPVATKRVAR